MWGQISEEFGKYTLIMRTECFAKLGYKSAKLQSFGETLIGGKKTGTGEPFSLPRPFACVRKCDLRSMIWRNRAGKPLRQRFSSPKG